MRPLLLVVEDDAATRTLLTVVLTRAGFEVDSVATARDAVTLLAAVPYSAITLDLYLRGTSGHDVLAAMAARPEVLQRIVVVTAAPASEGEELRRRYGVTVVRKPFDLHELVAKVKAIAAPAVPRDIVAEFCRRSIALGAKAGIVLTAVAQSASFAHAMSYGYPQGSIEEFFPMAVDAPYPICESYREGQDFWFPSVATRGSGPRLSEIWRAANAQAIVTFPLLSAERVIGAVGWAFREQRAFGETDRHHFGAIAGYLAASFSVD